MTTILKTGVGQKQFCPTPVYEITIITEWKCAPKGNFLLHNRIIQILGVFSSGGFSRH
ncbi:hypothetical protein FD41_GL000805 [Lentilactobacillus farraginis DSM 18382 = JCM 14108]|uniref:Uncharacterized protein n=1 Tax=Lentilactobacillus farraginis DSM 18382 = JCM 14108 TaxID=1423743 RepID=X0QEG0_9LACO|nr:hypothetical protein FD41_GL000805 [Lentilactobacillus farraginis DSM 18382 = JCM 14108]GAF36990.1 hypothetical protein JCM14108_1988 [Lentilactobacillus farraginis DSM 18382 = JCM 14108]